MLAHRLSLPKEEGQGMCLLPKHFTGQFLQHVGRKRRGEGREKKPGLGGRAELLRNSAQPCRARLDSCWGRAAESHTADGEGAVICR